MSSAGILKTVWTVSMRPSSNFLLCARGLRKRSNPGVAHQIKELENAAWEIQQNPEGFGDLESDMMNAHKSHKQYELEEQRQRIKTRQFVIKSKYFHDAKLPNFLTYAEKEQIRILHTRDPEQWSPEVLAESFPANTEIIRKILKANWKPLSENRKQAHDDRVFKNWEQFKKGEFDLKLPKDLRDHMKTFSLRSTQEAQTSLNLTTIPQQEQNVPMSSQFSSLITLGRKKENNFKTGKNAVTQKSSRPGTDNDYDETFLLDKVVGKKYVRIEELKQHKPELDNYSRPSEELVNSATDHKAQALDYQISSTTGVIDSLPSNFTQKFTLNEVAVSEEDKKRFEITAVKNRIHIPRKIYRPGATYRVEDSYYDDDGEFLYRVPGMTGGHGTR